MVQIAVKKPTLIVSCTDRKTLSTDGLQLRNLNIGSGTRDVEAIAVEWASKVRDALVSKKVGPVSARDLYCGEYWKIAKQTESLATVLVASAGLGLLKMDSKCPGYGATFATNSPDSIPIFNGDVRITRSKWWACLRMNGLGYSMDEVESEVVLVAVSSSYQEAIANDLKGLAASGKRVIVMSGSRKITQLDGVMNIDHIKTEQWLRMLLKGSTPSVGIRFAEHVIKENKWKSYEEIRAEYEELEKRYENSGSERLPKFDRKSMDPEKIENWIKKEIDSSSEDQRPAKSVLLRKFRDGGNACEQKKFGDLYNQVVDS